MKKILGLVAFFLFASVSLADTVIITKTRAPSVTPVIDTNIYAAGDAVGGKLSFTGAVKDTVKSGIISNIMITDLDKEAADLDVIFFNADPTGTTFTNNAALDIADADLSKIVCTVSVTTDMAFADNGTSYLNNINCPFYLASGTTLYGALVARGTPTYTSVSDLVVRVGILQD